MNPMNQTALDRWEGRYRSGETGWDRGQPSPALHHWLQSGHWPAGRVLVPGCGRGYEVVELARQGYRVTALDIAPTPLEDLGRMLDAHRLHAERAQADLFHWQPQQPFDAVYEQTCLCAIEPGQRQAYAQRLWQWLKPGGRLFAQFMQTDQPGGPPFHCAMDDMERLFPDTHWQWSDVPGPVVNMDGGKRELGRLLIRR